MKVPIALSRELERVGDEVPPLQAVEGGLDVDEEEGVAQVQVPVDSAVRPHSEVGEGRAPPPYASHLRLTPFSLEIALDAASSAAVIGFATDICQDDFSVVLANR